MNEHDTQWTDQNHQITQIAKLLSSFCEWKMDGLRQRRSPQPTTRPNLPSVKSVVRNLDLFPKVHEDYVIKTKEGGYGREWGDNWFIVSLVTFALMGLLLLSEVTSFFQVQRNDVITVRDSHDEQMFINFNITMYNVTCGSDLFGLDLLIELVFDVQDEDGVHSFGSSSKLTRMDLNENGTSIGFYRVCFSLHSYN